MACFSLFICLSAGLQPSKVKLQIVGTASFLNASYQCLKESPNKLLTKRFCSKLSLVKTASSKRAKCFEGVKHSLFILLAFCILGKFESANFGF